MIFGCCQAEDSIRRPCTNLAVGSLHRCYFQTYSYVNVLSSTLCIMTKAESAEETASVYVGGVHRQFTFALKETDLFSPPIINPSERVTYEERRSLQEVLYSPCPAPNLMLTDDWRRAALHYMGERVRSLLGKYGHKHTFLPTSHRAGCSCSRFTATTAAIRGPQKAGRGEKWHRLVFSARLYIDALG